MVVAAVAGRSWMGVEQALTSVSEGDGVVADTFRLSLETGVVWALLMTFAMSTALRSGGKMPLFRKAVGQSCFATVFS